MTEVNYYFYDRKYIPEGMITFSWKVGYKSPIITFRDPMGQVMKIYTLKDISKILRRSSPKRIPIKKDEEFLSYILNKLNIFCIHNAKENVYVPLWVPEDNSIEIVGKIVDKWVEYKKLPAYAILDYIYKEEPTLRNKFLNLLPKIFIIEDDNIDEDVFNKVSKNLYEHQKKALRKMLQLKKTVLWMETGGGKTITTLKTIEYLYLKDKVKNVLVLTSRKGVVDVWTKEIKKFGLDQYSDLKIIPITVRWFIDKLPKGNIKYKTLETSMDSFLKELFGDTNLDLLVIDEAHEIVSFYGKPKKSYKIAKVLSSKVDYLYMLTATPFVNDVDEIYGYLSLMGYNMFYIKNYKIPKKVLQTVFKYIFDKLTIKIDFNKGMVCKLHPVFVQLDDEYISRYYRDLLKLSIIQYILSLGDVYALLNFKDEKDKYNIVIGVLGILLSIMQRDLYGANPDEHTIDISHPRFVKLKELLDSEELKNEKVAIFMFNKINREFAEELSEYLNRPCFIYTGEYKDDLTKFQTSKNGVLFIGIRSGGVGINLESVKYIIFYQYWWTYTSFKQATDRIFRITSKDKIKKVYLLLTEPNILIKKISNSLFNEPSNKLSLSGDEKIKEITKIISTEEDPQSLVEEIYYEIIRNVSININKKIEEAFHRIINTFNTLINRKGISLETYIENEIENMVKTEELKEVEKEVLEILIGKENIEEEDINILDLIINREPSLKEHIQKLPEDKKEVLEAYILDYLKESYRNSIYYTLRKIIFTIGKDKILDNLIKDKSLLRLIYDNTLMWLKEKVDLDIWMFNKISYKRDIHEFFWGKKEMGGVKVEWVYDGCQKEIEELNKNLEELTKINNYKLYLTKLISSFLTKNLNKLKNKNIEKDIKDKDI